MTTPKLITTALLASLLVACTTHNGGSPDAGTTTGSGSGSGSASGSGSGSGTSSSCALPQGTYLIQYTLVTSDSQCEQLQSTTFTVDSAGQASLGTGPGCMTTYDNTRCATRTTCMNYANGYTDTSDANTTVSGSSASGTLHETESTNGSFVYDCTYDVSITKQ